MWSRRISGPLLYATWPYFTTVLFNVISKWAPFKCSLVKNQHGHSLTSPAYIIHKRLQDGDHLGKWKSRSWRGVYIGQSTQHASNVLLISVSCGAWWRIYICCPLLQWGQTSHVDGQAIPESIMDTSRFPMTLTTTSLTSFGLHLSNMTCWIITLINGITLCSMLLWSLHL